MRHSPDLGCLHACARCPDLSTLEGQAWIDQQVGDTEVLFADNISTLVRSGKENEAESWLPVQNWALRHRRSGRAVAMLHHAGKGGAQRGTSRREDVLDTVISVRQREDYSPRTQEEEGHRDRRTASTPAMAAAAAKNIAKKSASYAHANPRLKQETSAIIVISRTLASNPCSPLCRGLRLALS
jgi:hypothetical protein